MAGDCGLNALSLLPENVLPQWQQKIAMQKIMRVDEVTKHWTRLFSARSAIFCRYWTCTFSCRNNQAIGPRLSAFSPSFISHICCVPRSNGNIAQKYKKIDLKN